jgi:hypothetical protein
MRHCPARIVRRRNYPGGCLSCSDCCQYYGTIVSAAMAYMACDAEAAKPSPWIRQELGVSVYLTPLYAINPRNLLPFVSLTPRFCLRRGFRTELFLPPECHKYRFSCSSVCSKSLNLTSPCSRREEEKDIPRLSRRSKPLP